MALKDLSGSDLGGAAGGLVATVASLVTGGSSNALTPVLVGVGELLGEGFENLDRRGDFLQGVPERPSEAPQETPDSAGGEWFAAVGRVRTDAAGTVLEIACQYRGNVYRAKL